MKNTDSLRTAGAPRPMCYRCFKPAVRCICSQVSSVPNRTLVWIGQHPRERAHPLGTARIASLALERIHLEELRGRTASAPASLPRDAGLLFPADGARDLDRVGPDERPTALVVLDGTWSQARALVRDHPWLERLPRYRLRPRAESRYRLRKQPAPGCVSTIEAIAQALRILEPTTPGIEGLLDTFDAMIDQQLALVAKHRAGHRRRDAPRSLRGMPRWSLPELERVVVIGIESAPRAAPAEALVIVHCAALRLASGQWLEHFVRPPAARFPDAHHLRYLGLDAGALQAGSTPEELRAAWQCFAKADDVVVAWSTRVLEALDAAVGLTPRRIQLKSVYRSHVKQACGPLRTIVKQLGLVPLVAAPLHGRAGCHVAELAALWSHLQTPVGPVAGVGLRPRTS